MNLESDATPPLAGPLCSRLYCILEKTVPERGSLRDRWMVKLCDGRRVHAMAIEATPQAAVETAQKRAADLVRGLQEMHDAITKGPIKKI